MTRNLIYAAARAKANVTNHRLMNELGLDIKLCIDTHKRQRILTELRDQLITNIVSVRYKPQDLSFPRLRRNAN